MTRSDKGTVIVLLIAGILIGCLCVFGLFLQISVWIGGRQDATVVEWNKREVDQFVTFSYVNDSDDKSYVVEKKIQQRSVADLKDKALLSIRYSRMFPGRTEIIGMHEFDYLFYILGLLLMSLLCYRALRVLRGKLGVREFT